MSKLSDIQVDELVAIAYAASREENLLALARMGIFPRPWEIGGRYDSATLRWIAEKRLIETGDARYKPATDRPRGVCVVYPTRSQP